MRCDSCNKFVAFDTETDPESDVDIDSEGVVSGTVRITNNCEECGQEMKEATFYVDVDLSDEFAGHINEHKDDVDGAHSPELTFEATRTDRFVSKTRTGKAITNSRYMKHMYGAEGTIDVKCSCGGWEHSQEWYDEVAASAMEELM